MDIAHTRVITKTQTIEVEVDRFQIENILRLALDLVDADVEWQHRTENFDEMRVTGVKLTLKKEDVQVDMIEPPPMPSNDGL